MVQKFEIDFLPVGEGQSSGDAIAMRWENAHGQQQVLIYDGGTKDYGKALVQHVKTYYGTGHVDYVVNTHPDNDHAGGLLYVLENMTVGQLWMHRPWAYSSLIRDYFHDGRITDDSLARRLQEKMSAAYALEQVAEKRGIPIFEPFAGERIGIFTVLSPTEERYVHELLPEFEKAPELKVVATAEALFDKTVAVIERIAAHWNKEVLPDVVKTSAENESSVVMFALTRRGGYLLTGDAGIKSLRAAAEYAEGVGYNLPSEVTFVQIPHHGGRRNVSTETLNLIVGEPLVTMPEKPTKTAFVSAAKAAPTHPKRIVTNAFVRRGFKVSCTKGRAIRHKSGYDGRAGWETLEPLPFYDEVEA